MHVPPQHTDHPTPPTTPNAPTDRPVATPPQVANHPLLASVGELLRGTPHQYTVVARPDGGPGDLPYHPTPILIRGAERRVDLRIDPDEQAGRPDGFFGGTHFVDAPDWAVSKASPYP